jgi:hypothetical protein
MRAIPLPDGIMIVTPEALKKAIAWQMKLANRRPPMLRGKSAARDPDEVDRVRADFASWLVDACFAGGGMTVLTEVPKPHHHANYYPGAPDNSVPIMGSEPK